MRGEVEHDPVLLVFAEVHPRGRDEVDLAQRAVLDQVADLVDRRAVEEGVAGHEDQPELVGELDQLDRLVGRARERLLDEDVLARLQGARGPANSGYGAASRSQPLRASGRRGRHPGRTRRPRLGSGLRNLDQTPLIALAKSGQTELRPLGQIAHDVRPPVAVTDDERLDRMVEVHLLTNGTQNRGLARNPRSPKSEKRGRVGRKDPDRFGVLLMTGARLGPGIETKPEEALELARILLELSRRRALVAVVIAFRF